MDLTLLEVNSYCFYLPDFVVCLITTQPGSFGKNKFLHLEEILLYPSHRAAQKSVSSQLWLMGRKAMSYNHKIFKYACVLMCINVIIILISTWIFTCNLTYLLKLTYSKFEWSLKQDEVRGHRQGEDIYFMVLENTSVTRPTWDMHDKSMTQLTFFSSFHRVRIGCI